MDLEIVLFFVFFLYAKFITACDVCETTLQLFASISFNAGLESWLDLTTGMH